MNSIDQPCVKANKILAPAIRFDEIDDRDILVDPYELHAPSKRSDKELAAVLALLDELDTGKQETR